MPTQYIADGISDVGLVRKNNEDSFLIDKEIGLSIVCDGVGGHKGGEYASRETAKLCQKSLRENQKVIKNFLDNANESNAYQVQRLIDHAINLSCQRVWQMGREEGELQGMGTTIVLTLILGKKCFLAHVGDSRAYLFRNSDLIQMTEDHSLVMEMFKNGLIQADQLEKHPDKNILSRAIGMSKRAKVDQVFFDLYQGDTIVLCTDGVTDLISNEEIKNHCEVLSTDEYSTTKIGNTLVGEANKRGGKDNSTVVCIRLSEGESNKRILEKTEALKRISLFENYTYKELVKLLNIAKVRNYKKGDIVIQKGDAGQELFVSLKGTIGVYSQSVLLNTIGKHEYFGEMALIRDELRSANLVANDDCRVLIFPKASFIKLLSENPGMESKTLWRFLEVLSNRVVKKDRDILELNEKLHLLNIKNN